MDKLIPVESEKDIPKSYQKTPIGEFLRYHNLEKNFEPYTQAQLLIGMCMDSRKHLRIPDNFAFIIRSGGANLRPAEFKVSYAIGVGGIQHIAIIGHNHCGMVDLASRKNVFIKGLVEKAGWHPAQAEEHFYNFASTFEIGNEIQFVLAESHRLNLRYPKVMVAPMLYKVEDNRVYLIPDEVNEL